MNELKYSGLNDKEVLLSREKFGSNQFEKKKRKGFLLLFFEGFCDPIVEILIAALAVNIIFSFQTFHWYETLGIISAVIISTLVSTLSEMGSEKAFDKMQENADKGFALVRRNGKSARILQSELVSGDIIIIESGEIVPADGFILQGEIKVDQSALNGESKEIIKYPSYNKKADITFENYVCRGSVCSSGKAIMLADKVGKNTTLGKIASSLSSDIAPSPLKERLGVLAKQISKIGYASALCVCFISLFHSFIICGNFDINQIKALILDPRYVFSEILSALALAITVVVVAVPEGLPMMISVVLSANMKKMMKQNVLVRKPVAIETAGSMNILFTDKTGTLTLGRQSLDEIVCANGISFSPKSKSQIPVFTKFAEAVIISSECTVEGNIVFGSNSSDRALTQACLSQKIKVPQIMKRKPFDSIRKYSEVILFDSSGFIKGAPEILIPATKGYYDENCGIHYDPDKGKLFSLYEKYAKNGKRVIFIGEKTKDGKIIFIAFGIISDPIRSDAEKCVKLLQKAGIKIIMITGDGKETASYIAEKTGILKKDDLIFSGSEIAKMSDEKLSEIIEKTSVIYRLLPQDKERLIEISEKRGLVAGMTGDGINDAPALIKSDVGFAMQSGTDIAKESGGIVLLDDSLMSLTKAVLFGRTIFKSIRKFIVFQLSMNFIAVGVSVLAPLFGIEMPITVMQMLWINLIMDTLGGLAFAGESPKLEYMAEKPKKKNEKIMSKEMISQIKIFSLSAISFLMCFLILPISRNAFHFQSDYPYFMTVFFASFIFMAILIAFCTRTERINILSGLFSNKAFILVMLLVFGVQILIIYFGGELFSVVPIFRKDLIFSALFAQVILIFDTIRKILLKRKHKSP